MVSTSTLIISLFLLVLGIWTLLWLLFALLSPLFGQGSASRATASTQAKSGSTSSSLRGFHERLLFRRRVRVFQDLDAAIRDNRLVVAKRLLPKALYLEWIQWSPELIAKSASHHLDLLNKLIVIAELEGSSVRSLPKLESLFAQRASLLNQAFEARIARSRFRTKQRTKGKTPPHWSTKEFDQRLATLQQEFADVRGEILTLFAAAIAELDNAKSSTDDLGQYH